MFSHWKLQRKPKLITYALKKKQQQHTCLRVEYNHIIGHAMLWTVKTSLDLRSLSQLFGF